MKEHDVFAAEEEFHDSWANSVDVSEIDVVKMNESITAPEMQYITSRIENIKGIKLLDIGCGLGEASVYFALKGADVTATDISAGMLEVTEKLGNYNKVKIHTHKSTAESLCFEENAKFDVVYVGNLFHHVNTEEAIQKIQAVLSDDGKLLSWDPLAYNPVINIYRLIATKVRTKDEHPFKVRDIRLFKKYFKDVKVRYFWLTTLIIFIMMALIQFRNPNKERYWKKVVEEGSKWKHIYLPLEKLDRFILTIFPFLGIFCWNVVIEAKGSRK